MTVLSAPVAQSSSQASRQGNAPPSHDGGSTAHEDPLRLKRTELQTQQQQLLEVRRVIARLESVRDGDGGRTKQRSPDEELLAPLSDVAFVRGTIADEWRTTRDVYIDADSELANEINSSSSSQGDQVDGKVRIPAQTVLGHLKAKRETLEKGLNALRQEVIQTAQKYYAQHIGESLKAENVELDEKGQAINEEGLPFVDLTEPLPQQGESEHGRGITLPFAPTEHKSKEERKAWMNSIFDELEQEEGHEEDNDEDRKAPQERSKEDVEMNETADRQTLHHKRVSSAEQPAPIKSVLKHSSASDGYRSGQSTPQRFGASGFRKGFLNMNPHSPGAEHSSDPIEAIRFGARGEPMTTSTSSLGSAADMIRYSGGDSGSGSEDRMSRSMEIDGHKERKKKKTVRIQSPESERRKQRSSSSSPLSVKQQFNQPLQRLKQDENVEAEAKHIVDLLGIEAIQGHPQYDSIKAEMGQSALPGPSASASTASSAKRKASASSSAAGPAIRKDVVERQTPSANASRLAGATSKSPSAFKRGFLNKPQQPQSQPPPLPSPLSSLPSAPRQSQGVSALERATSNDEALSDQRRKQGLNPAVPHARPSKAFAEKLNARNRAQENGGQQDVSGASASIEREAEDDLPARMSKVRFGQDDEGQVDVRVGTAATEATGSQKHDADDDYVMDGDEADELNEIGMEVYDEELDDEQIEALGYFTSDEEFADGDPDVGFDKDDLMLPTFDGDAGTINNEELRREYERIKAKLDLEKSKAQLHTPKNDEIEQELRAGQEFSLADDEETTSDAKVSRFRRERLHRAMMGKRAVSHELQGAGDAGQGMRNVGPSMLIPSLANVRYPKRNAEGQIPTQAGEIELDGKSDDEEDRLEDVMRARLEVHKQQEQQQESRQAQSDPQPPTVAASTTATKGKKPSLFKSRMQNGGVGGAE